MHAHRKTDRAHAARQRDLYLPTPGGPKHTQTHAGMGFTDRGRNQRLLDRCPFLHLPSYMHVCVSVCLCAPVWVGCNRMKSKELFASRAHRVCIHRYNGDVNRVLDELVG